MFEQFLKGGADGGFVLDAELGEFGERIVIGGYGLVRGLEGQARHGAKFARENLRRQFRVRSFSAPQPGPRSGEEGELFCGMFFARYEKLTAPLLPAAKTKKNRRSG